MMNIDVMAKVGTVNTPYVVAGAYEERPELMNQTPFYKMRLDCLVMPEEELIIKEFYGTLEQIDDLLSEIEKDDWWCEYYASTLDAWNKYRAGDIAICNYERYSLLSVSGIAQNISNKTGSGQHDCNMCFGIWDNRGKEY